MPWVRIDDDFSECDDGAAIGVLGRGLLTDLLCYCNRNLTDGFVPSAIMVRHMADPDFGGRGEEVLQRLLRVELVAVDEARGGYCIPNFHKYQPSRREVERDRAQRRASKSASGKAGAAVRWGSKVDGKVDGKRVAKRIANVQRTARQTDSPVPLEDQNQDQDPALRADDNPAGQPKTPTRIRSRPKEPASFQVLGAIVRDLVGQRTYTDDADLKEDLKRQCARLGLAYDSDQVRKAVDSGQHQVRRLNGHGRQAVGR